MAKTFWALFRIMILTIYVFKKDIIKYIGALLEKIIILNYATLNNIAFTNNI